MHSLEITMFGSFQARRGELTLEGSSWGRRKNLQLLKYFLTHRGHPLSQERLIEAIYPEQPSLKSVRNLLGRISELRRILEPDLKHGNHSTFILRVSQGTYMFSAEAACRIDVEEFRDSIKRGAQHVRDGAWEAALSQYTRAVTLYRGDFLAEDLYEEWTLYARERYRIQYIESLLNMAECQMALRSFAQAAETFDQVIEVDSIEERAHRGRMLAHYQAGNRRQALVAYKECVRVLEEQGLEPDEESATLHQAITDQTLPQESAGARDNLPKATTPFFGRTEEIKELKHDLHNPNNRVVTLLGPGGIGKSRLALEAAHQALSEYQDGVHFVNVPRNASAEQLLSAIVERIMIPLQERQDLRQQVLNALRSKDALLIIDNAEHAIEATDVLEDIVHTTRVQLLAASRRRLHITGELIVEVQGLSHYGGDSQDVDATSLERYDSTQLFVDRMRRVNHRFTLTQDVAPDVARICRVAQGMPLAIELAASWGRALSCREIADGVERSFRDLESLSNEAPPEHRSVRAIFDHTWSLLSGEEQALFAKLSVFHGSMSSHAALRVTQTSLSTIMSLRDKALLQRALSDRYTMHELLRQFAEERLNLDPVAHRNTHDAHARYFTEHVAACNSSLRNGEQIKTLDRLQTDSDNLQAAWLWNVDQNHAERLEAMIDSYYRFHELRNRWYDLDGLFTYAIARVRAHTSTVKEADEPLVAHPHLRLLGTLLSRQGMARFHLGSFTEAEEALQEGLDIARKIQERALEAACLSGIGTARYTVGEVDESEPHLQESLLIMREVGSDHDIAGASSKLGVLHRLKREFDEAERHFQECLKTYQRLGDPTETAGALLNLGTIYGSRGDMEEAQRHFQESLDMAKQVGHRILTFMNTGNLGYLAYMQEDFETAKAMYQESWEVAHEVGNREGLVFLCYYLCLANAKLNEVDEAARYIRHGLEESLELNAPALTLRLVYALGHMLQARGFSEDAMALFSFSLNHSATPEPTKEGTRKDLEQLKTSMSEEVVAQAVARAESLTLDEIRQWVQGGMKGDLGAAS